MMSAADKFVGCRKAAAMMLEAVDELLQEMDRADVGVLATPCTPRCFPLTLMRGRRTFVGCVHADNILGAGSPKNRCRLTFASALALVDDRSA